MISNQVKRDIIHVIIIFGLILGVLSGVEWLISLGKKQEPPATASSSSPAISAQQNQPQTAQQKTESKENKVPKEPTLKEKGDSCYKAGDYAEAISYYTQAINKGTDAYLSRGNAYQKQGDYVLAISDYTKVIEDGKIKIKNTENLYNSLLLGSASDKPDAMNDLNKKIAIENIQHELAHAYFGRGYSYSQQGDLDNAIADYTKTLELSPRNSSAYNNRGVCYEQQGDEGQALANYTKAIEVNPKEALYYNNRGKTYRRLGHEAEAEADFAKAQELEAKQ